MTLSLTTHHALISHHVRTIDHGNDAPPLDRTARLFEGTGGRFSDVTNPATGEVTAQLALASEADVNAVVAAAAAAFPAWRDTSLAKRTQILFAFRELLNHRKDELAALITAEHGKVHSDACSVRSPEGRKSSSSPVGSQRTS